MQNADAQFVLDREQYEHLVALCLGNMGCPDELHQGIIKRAYPQNAEATLAELHWRGYDVTIQEVLAFAHDADNEVQSYCGFPLFTQANVDKLARMLLSHFRLNDVAKTRRRDGVTAAEAVAESVAKFSAELQRRAVDAARN